MSFVPRPTDTQIMVTAPAQRKETDSLIGVCEALRAQSFAVTVSTTVAHYCPAPSLVIVLDGWGTLSLWGTIKTLQALLPQVPKLAIASSTEVSLASVLEAGFDDAVSWPLAAAELIARARARLRRPQTLVLRITSLDPVNLTIRCDALCARLTRAEFRLLHVLFQHPGLWVTRSELQNLVWREGRPSRTSVAAHVHALRRKLEHHSWRLQSDRRLGYRFVQE